MMDNVFHVYENSVGIGSSNTAGTTLDNCRICYLDYIDYELVNKYLYDDVRLSTIDYPNLMMIKVNDPADIDTFVPESIPKVGMYPFYFEQKIGEIDIVGYMEVFDKITSITEPTDS